MVRIGWMQDIHQPQTGSQFSGPQDRFTADLVSLREEYGVNEVFCTGDCAHPKDNDRGNVPHITEADAETFWQYVDESGHGAHVRAIPGNHDVPLQTFLESDVRAIWRGRFSYEGVTVILLTTAVSGVVTGSPGRPSEQGGVGVNTAYVSYADLAWLEEQLKRADDDAKIVLPHHATYFVNSPKMDAYSPDGNYRERNSYDVCLNYKAIHGVLSSFEKVVVPFSHLYQFDFEGSYTVDGVTYAWKKHYYDFSADRVTTYAYIEADATSVRTITVDRRGRETVIVNQAWL